jgi:histone deacetylase 1/2
VKDFGAFDDEPIPIFCDNQSSIKITQNLVFHTRIKHIKVCYHFIREKVLSKEIDLNQVPIKNQIVDNLPSP